MRALLILLLAAELSLLHPAARAELFYRRALRAMSGGDSVEAERLASRAVALDPGHAGAREVLRGREWEALVRELGKGCARLRMQRLRELELRLRAGCDSEAVDELRELAALDRERGVDDDAAAATEALYRRVTGR